MKKIKLVILKVGWENSKAQMADGVWVNLRTANLDRCSALILTGYGVRFNWLLNEGYLETVDSKINGYGVPIPFNVGTSYLEEYVWNELQDAVDVEDPGIEAAS